MKAVVLDVDGTLVDSNDAHAEAWVDALAEHGHVVPFTRIRPLVGMGADKLLPAVVGLAEESPDGARIGARRKEIFRDRYLPGVRALPGAARLVERMREQGLTLVVASSAKADELGPLLRKAGAGWLAEDSASSDDAERSKPDPDIVRAALAKTGCPAADVVMIGDTPYDVEAARRAGIAVIAFRCGGWGDADLRGAVAVYEGPDDLLARYDASPLRRSGT